MMSAVVILAIVCAGLLVMLIVSARATFYLEDSLKRAAIHWEGETKRANERGDLNWTCWMSDRARLKTAQETIEQQRATIAKLQEFKDDSIEVIDRLRGIG